MNIQIKNKIVKIVFETRDPGSSADFEVIIKEILNDLENGAKEFHFCFMMVRTPYHSQIIGMMLGMANRLSEKGVTIKLTGVKEDGIKELKECHILESLASMNVIIN